MEMKCRNDYLELLEDSEGVTAIQISRGRRSASFMAKNGGHNSVIGNEEVAAEA